MAAKMLVSISGIQRRRFAADLKNHRDSFALNDAVYARDVLKISLNTFKRCVEDTEQALTLKRQTFVSIFQNAGLGPSEYGLSVSLPVQANQYGGYDKRSYAYLCGRFALYRRSFLTAENLNRSVLDIRQSSSKECLIFSEVHSYVSDGGVRDEHRYDGEVHIDRDRTILSLPAYREGQVRLTLVQMPQRSFGRGKIKLRGALLTFGIPRGYWQPTVSCIFGEGPLSDSTPTSDLCGTIQAGGDEYHRLSLELVNTEEHSVVLTPLLWRKLRSIEDAATR